MATQQIGLPGVYMDAVNPDYLVVGLLNRNVQPIAAQLVNGNYVFGRVPILISFYHGSQQLWLGLPFFALFGTTVAGLRLTHAMFALAILAAMYALLARDALRPWQAALVCVALAVDPAFSYAFRTQSYITLAPTAWLFLSLYALQRAAASNASPRRWLVASGVGYGLAIFGYFIYAFYFPAMLLALWLWNHDHRDRPRGNWVRGVLPWWLCGLAAGAIFYPIGYGLNIRYAGGLAEAWSQFEQTQRALGAFSAQVPLPARFAHLGTMLGAVVSNWFHHMLIFGEYAPLPGWLPKTWLLVAGPVALWLYAEARDRSSVLLRILIALPLSYVLIAMTFGTRLQGHHFVPLLPIAYAALAVAMRADAAARNPPGRWSTGVAVLVFAGIIALNVVGQRDEARRLTETRGVGLYSDAVNRLGTDLAAMNPKPFVYFPDWGLSMPAAFLTGGTVGMAYVENLPEARLMLCSGRDVALAVITGDRAARIADWQRALHWSAPSISEYRQGDGKVVFELATFKGQRDTSDCVPLPPG